MDALIFQGRAMRVIERDGQLWLTAADIAAALGYSRSDKVSRIYQIHSAEFRPSMSTLVETPVSGFSGLTAEARLFSLRGAHLIGMLARTKVAAEFRSWVLDQLEAQAIPQKSLMAAWFKAKAAVDAQDKFASLCGKGLSEHRQIKPPLKQALDQISDQIQPSLLT